MSALVRTLVAAGALLAAGIAPAQPAARCPPAAPGCAAPAATSATSPPVRKKTLADLLRERDGADRSRPAPRPFARDGAEVLPERMGAV